MLPLLVCLLALNACSIAPRNKTVVLDAPAPSAASTARAPGEKTFDIEKISVVALDKLDRAGILYKTGRPVFGWLDDEHLAALSVDIAAAEDQSGEQPAPTSPAPAVPSIAIQRSGATGYTSSIVSLDWQYGFQEPLLELPDAVVFSAGLSPDRSRAWYIAMADNPEAKSKETTGRALVVTDSRFQKELLRLDNYDWSDPVWSTTGNYLCLINVPPFFSDTGIFDMSGDTANPYPIENPETLEKYIYGMGLGLLGFNPGTEDMLLSYPSGVLRTQKVDAKPDFAEKLDGFGDGAVTAATLLRSGYSVGLVNSLSGNDLVVMAPDNGGVAARYEKVADFAFSDDEQYICIARQTGSETADIYVANWKDGSIQNQRLVLKGFLPNFQCIYFSPDNDKLFLSGKYRTTDAGVTGLVLKFR